MLSATEQARFNMIQQQIRPWDVMDNRVLDAMMSVPREKYVPDAYVGLAYADIEIPINADQVMMAPKVVGRMLQALNVQPGKPVLEVGTGTGYVTACMAQLGAEVRSMEIDEDLQQQAAANLRAQGVSAKLQTGDGLGRSAYDYDAIAVTGSVPSADALETLLSQLAPGGRLFAVIGENPAMQACLFTRTETGMRQEILFETSLIPLANAPEPERFSF